MTEKVTTNVVWGVWCGVYLCSRPTGDVAHSLDTSKPQI